MNRQLPSIPKWRTIRNAPRFLSNPIALMKENIAELGDTYRLTLGGQSAIFTADPHFIQYVLQKNHRNYYKSPPHFDKIARYLGYGLLTIEGQRWRKQRRLIQPGFHKQRIANLTNIMNAVISEFLEEFDQKIQKGPVDMYHEMQGLAFNLVARSIFNLHIDQTELQRVSLIIEQLQSYVIKEIRTPFLMPWLKLSGQQKQAQKLAAESDEIIRRFIEARRNSDQSFDDLLQMLLDARYEDTGTPMSEQQLLDEVKILFVAGHDTSGNALSWVWHLLERHPDWLEQVKVEAEHVFGRKLPVFEDIAQLPISKQVLEETMRLFPPAWITDRMALKEDEYEGITIAKDTMLITFLYGAHHHPDFWKDPEDFRPDRFAAANKDKIVQASFLPFGSGPRMCIGNSFAMLEMQLVLSRMAGKYTFKAVDSQEVEPLALITLKPKQGVWMEVRKR